ncbi:hypothetical protein BGW36DRAFT_363458 [Talaromyces proteolyticus]|uniref:WW domain-containing protein n=1 Tax=Talaromyces proteolyticus TaxID=1131652 RepID=A0AAD4KH67_9EURO|nr:uncharacterized protein BGW36DRAFT_363458 [Talaromyces proteolyticus]KAH8691112.1 hypothetical protein BGW36DRAFT_363458 [Talaromyces proteolyticus]
MSFAPPPGPPPPPVPPGWKAQFDDRYKQWYFVNLKTGVSQWTVPEEPGDAPADAPPSYHDSGPANPAVAAAAGDDKSRLASNNPYNHPRGSNIDDDAKLAAQLQAEEDARANRNNGGTSRGENVDYYNSQPSPSPGSPQAHVSGGSQTNAPPADQRQRGLLGKIFGKSNDRPGGQQPGYGYQQNQQQYPPQQGYGYGGPPQPQYGGYPPQGGYYPPNPGYGGGYGYPPQQQPVIIQQQPARSSGGGLGTMGGAALGLGGGLLAGALITDAVEDHDQNEYDQGYDQGYDDGGGDF